EHKVCALSARVNAPRIPCGRCWLVDQAAHVLGRSLWIGRKDFDRHNARRAIRVLLQFGNPNRLAREMLAGEDAHAAWAFGERPAEHVELGFTRSAIRQIDGTAEMHWPERLQPARLEVG